jgi:HlyD family secretion protein
MVIANNKLFRKKALERASSPEQLDQVIQLVRPHHWLPLYAFGSLMVAGIPVLFSMYSLLELDSSRT